MIPVELKSGLKSIDLPDRAIQGEKDSHLIYGGATRTWLCEGSSNQQRNSYTPLPNGSRQSWNFSNRNCSQTISLSSAYDAKSARNACIKQTKCCRNSSTCTAKPYRSTFKWSF